jgi:CheY-like chemotaxis protein
MLRNQTVDPAQVPRVLDVLERNAIAQAQLIADVLDVSRMITGKVRLELRTVGLGSIVRDAIDTVRPAADGRKVTIHFSDPGGDWIVQADAHRLQQVVWNLLSNAVKFTPPGGYVRVTFERTPHAVAIVVSDSGPGLAAEFLPFAFDRFRQADQSFTRTHGGLGLGLAIVKHVAELHGGRVEAQSTGPDGGAVFRVSLPTPGVLADAIQDEVARSASLGSRDLQGHSILVVDDDEATRDLMTALLTSLGARVRTAASVREAVAALDAELPSLIVADLGMPGEDGLSLARRLRQRPRDGGANVPAVALSAYARAEDRAAALAAGFDAFVAKPAAPDDLVTTIRQTLGAGPGSHPR